MTGAEPNGVTVRPMLAADLPAAVRMQDESYPAFLTETVEAFASRLNMAGACCLVAEREDVAVGYLLAHCWAAASPPPVGTILPAEPPACDILYIHDLCVAAAGRGGGVGRMLIDRAFAWAHSRGVYRAELIAVEGAGDYWRRLGFDDASCPPDLAARVAGYGPQARWMTAVIAG